MVRVNLEVTEEKKEKWQKEASQHPEANGNLSAFIRASVEREIVDDRSGGSIESEEIMKKLGEIGNSINQVNTRLDSVETRLASVERETTRDPEIEELKGKIFDCLPDKEPGTRGWKAKQNKLEITAGENDAAIAEYESWQGTIEGLSRALDEPEFAIQQAIERLQENTELIRTTEYGGETRYWRVE